MKFPTPHYDAVKNSVMISGIFRSGTTILGKVVGSFKNVEYSHEPPLAFHLDYLIQEKKIDDRIAADLLRTYFAEDIMINFHHGRGYNMRPTDDSCIFLTKAYQEVMCRWQKVKNSRDAILFMRDLGSRLVFKVPAAYSLIPVLLDNFEGLKVIEIQRNLKSILSSILAKKWFTNQELSQKDYASNWPYYDDDEPIHVPYYFDRESVQAWRAANEETKSVQILNCLVKRRLETQKKVTEKYPDRFLIVKYEDLLDSPKTLLNEIAGFLEMEFTQKTLELIDTIKPTKRVYNIDEVLAKCDSVSSEKFLENNSLLGYEN